MAKLRVNKIAAVGVSTENTGSVFFDGTGDYIATEVSNDFALGTNDFTFEMWVYYESRSTGDTPAVLDSTTTTYAPLIGYIENDASTNGHAVVYISANGSSWGIASNKTFGLITAKQWYHLAISRSGSNFYLFKDGILTDSFTSSSAIHQGANQIGFGRIQSSVYFDGYISNARLCNGHAVYTENFTPPTRELEVHPETVFLGLYDGENIFAEKTGKIIAAYGDRSSGISTFGGAADSPIGITTFNPELTRNVDQTAGPTFQGGVSYNSQNWLTLPKGTTEQRGRGRGLFAGGESPGKTNLIDFINISSSGIAASFGDLTIRRKELGGCASATRGVFAGGSSSGESPAPPLSRSNVIDYVTLASTGNAGDFGDLIDFQDMIHCGLSNSTRGIWAGGEAPSAPSGSNVIQYVTIATIGNTQEFGDLIRGTREGTGCASPTRGIIFGNGLGEIQYITISTLGNAIDFGDHTFNSLAASCSDSTRGLIGGGTNLDTGGTINTIQYITIATTGDAQDFGDLTVARKELAAVSNSIRGVFAGGNTGGNTIDYVTVQTTGNAVDWGDLPTEENQKEQGSGSDSHGGIS